MRFHIPIIALIRSFSTKVKEDNINAFSAQAAFLIMLSFFPFIMFLLTLLQYLPFSQETMLNFCLNLFPEAINGVITVLVTELYASSSGTLLSITVVTAVWMAGKGFLALVQGLNSVYNIKENRNYFRLRIVAMLYTVVFAIIMVILLTLFVFGNQLILWLTNNFPITKDFGLLMLSIRTIVVLTILVLFFLAMYLFIPNRNSRLLAELPGAIVSAAGWVGFSLLYSFYIDNMSNMAATYGSLTAIVLCMLWLYACMFITFIGAEINSVLANPLVVRTIKKLNKARKEEKEDSKK